MPKVTASRPGDTTWVMVSAAEIASSDTLNAALPNAEVGTIAYVAGYGTKKQKGLDGTWSVYNDPGGGGGGGTAEDVTYDEEQDYSDGTVGKKLSSLSAEKVNKHEESYAGKVLGYDENGDAHPVDGGASAWNDVSGKPFDSVGDGLTTEGGVLKAVLVGESDTAFSFRIDENGHLILQSTDAALEIFDFYINEQGHLIIELEENNNG